jgi:hypothetical protein
MVSSEPCVAFDIVPVIRVIRIAGENAADFVRDLVQRFLLVILKHGPVGAAVHHSLKLLRDARVVGEVAVRLATLC